MDGPGQVVSYQDDLGKLLAVSLSLVDQCSLCKIAEMNLRKAQKAQTVVCHEFSRSLSLLLCSFYICQKKFVFQQKMQHQHHLVPLSIFIHGSEQVAMFYCTVKCSGCQLSVYMYVHTCILLFHMIQFLLFGYEFWLFVSFYLLLVCYLFQTQDLKIRSFDSRAICVIFGLSVYSVSSFL